MNSNVTRRTRHIAAYAIAISISIGAFSTTARAEGNGVTLDAFRPAELATDGFSVARPLTLRRGAYGARLTLDYGLRELSFDASGGALDYDVVRHHLTGTASVAFALHDRLTLAVGIPLSMVMRGQTPTAPGFPGVDGTLAGDPFIALRARLVGDDGDRFILGAQLRLSAPLADAASHLQLWSGDGTPVFSPSVLGELNVTNALRVNFSLGARFRGVARQPYLTVGQEMTFGAAVTYAVVPALIDVTAEAYGSTDFGALPGNSNSPVELLAGVRAHPTDEWHAGLALGTAISGGYGAADFRGVFTVSYAQVPTIADDLGDPEEVFAEPDTDADDDGIDDATDACAALAEDADSFEDEDGCPDLDDDADGIPDTSDAAPHDAEDADGFQDEDGAPDPDNDDDGIPDGDDRCATEAEDRDGVVDEDGCPETDADADTIADADDRCAMTPGVTSAEHAECNGCPAAACIDPSGTIRILQRIEFANNGDTIRPQSLPVLESVQAILSTTSSIRRVRIEGHTDDRGRPEANQDLSRRRAESVVRWLVEHGITADRLESAGLGDARPLLPNTSNANRAQNRRVEFHIVDPAPATP